MSWEKKFEMPPWWGFSSYFGEVCEQWLTVGDVSDERVEEECPAQRIDQRLFQLIPLEMLVTHTLRINPNTLNCQNPILLTQPPTVQLVIRHDPQERNTKTRRKQSRNQENNLPGLHDSAILATSHSNAVSNAAAEDLRKAVETKPDGCAGTLLFLGVPLRGEEGETGGYGCFEDAEEEADGYCSGVVFYGCEAG